MEGISERDMELIDKYLMGTLSQEDALDFSQRSKDPDFENNLSFIQSAKTVAQEKGDAEMRKVFHHIDQELDKKMDSNQDNQKDKIRGRQKYMVKWLLIISLLGIISVLLFYVLESKGEKREILLADFYEPMPNLVAPIEKGANGTTLYEKGFRSYERGEYRQAIREFDQPDTTDPIIIFYKGLSHLAVEETDQSISLLTHVRKLPKSTISDAADWYLMMAYLQKGDLQKSKNTGAEILAMPNHKYKIQTQKLLARLEK